MTNPARQRWRWLLLASAAMASGCAHFQKQPEVKYQTIAANSRRDTATAKVKHAEALVFLDNPKKHKPKYFAKAEALLNEALVADVRYGPAHNSLGHLYFLQDKLYLAAWEFEYAAKLMPDLAEPLNNLGLVYERAGKSEEAISYFSMAMSVSDSDPVVVANLVRARMADGEKSNDLKYMVSDLALNHPDAEWRRWARDQVALTRFDEPDLGPESSWKTDEAPEALPTPVGEPSPAAEPGTELLLPPPGGESDRLERIGDAFS